MNMHDLPETEQAAALEKRVPERAEELMLIVPTATPTNTNAEIRKLFTDNPLLVSVPIIEGASPIGLITREIFLGQMARPYAAEVFGKKSCIAFMDKSPLVVDRRTSITDLSARAVETGEKALKDGYIVTEDGRYAGVGLGFELVKALSDLQVEKNRMLTDSINYASVIQRSFLSNSKEQLAATLGDHFMEWQPRDVVGGDCYFFTRRKNLFFMALIDCTGHGVPGAFMTLIAASLIEQAITMSDLRDPAGVMGNLNRLIKTALRQQSITADIANQSDDGLDAAFFCLDAEEKSLTFAGAKTPLFMIPRNDGKVEMIDGNRKGVGYVDTPMDYQWDNQIIAATPGTKFYITTDGIIDQIGGPRRIAFGKKRLQEVLSRNHALPMPVQRKLLMDVFLQYQGAEPRRDDVTMTGFHITDALLASLKE